MSDRQSFMPEVSDEDIEWACGLMGLRDFDESREEFLRAITTLDVSACPGSGKTTLVVAKLAILARKWPYRTKGICVLSHTNAAREEIQHRLRGTLVGEQLLSYPHFVDTIHGFVNRFLALPWLNSNGYPSPTIDDDIAVEYRRRALNFNDRKKVDVFLEKKHSGFDRIRLKDRELRFNLGGKEFPAGPSAPTHKIVKRAVEASSEAGYFCYDEMFIWAKALVSDFPGISSALQQRFPLVIIDEMQDTSAVQMEILESVFPRSDSESAVQRVGDPNQTLYEGPPPDGATPGAFPDAACLQIPKSFRFGERIADLASPFAVEAVGLDGLQGAGPRAVADACECSSNVAFIFADARPQAALDAFGRHVLANFSDAALEEGHVAAVGAVHQDAGDIKAGHAHFPKTVSHYWSGYKAEIARRDSHPQSLVQYVRVARALVQAGRDFAPGVEKIASGIVRLARRAGDAEFLGRRAPKHRALMDALAVDEGASAAYRRLIRAFLIDQDALNAASWNQWKTDMLVVAAALNESGSIPNSEDHFLRWHEHDPSLPTLNAESAQDSGPNVYRVQVADGRNVNIHLGSIHSMKGQTHLATLLLSTYWLDHSAKKMLPWLIGEKTNLNGAGQRDRKRLFQTYVAMTRPSHLVCLAIPMSLVGDGSVMSGHIAKLKKRGWTVATLMGDKTTWHT